MAEADTITIGGALVTALSDGGPAADTPAKLSRLFPGVAPERFAPFQPRFPRCYPALDEWVADFNVWLVRTEALTVLVDAGLGRPGGLWAKAVGGLLDSLRAHGVAPEAIDRVVLTHLHSDHVGWLLSDAGTPTFPRARYLVGQPEWDFLQRPDGRSTDEVSIAGDLTRLAEHGVLDLLPDETALSPEIRAIPTRGHTPGHQSVLVTSRGEQCLLMGDLVHHPAQVTERAWCPIWDVDCPAAAVTRARVLDWVERSGMIAAAYHFPAPGFGRVVREGDRPYWQPLATMPD